MAYIPVWHLYTQKSISAIEQVQRRPTRMLLRQRPMVMSYENRLKQLNWNSLELRRKFLLISFVVKTIFHEIECERVINNINLILRHADVDVRFAHLKAKTERLHQTAARVSPVVGFSTP